MRPRLFNRVKSRILLFSHVMTRGWLGDSPVLPFAGHLVRLEAQVPRARTFLGNDGMRHGTIASPLPSITAVPLCFSAALSL